MQIDKDGVVRDPRVRIARAASLERGAMHSVKGIIVHQTDSDTASATLNSYANPKANGAHFLIDRDGTIFQTASVYQVTWHVGSLKARCLAEHRCTPVELAALKKFNPSGEHRRESAKAAPSAIHPIRTPLALKSSASHFRRVRNRTIAFTKQ